MYDEFNPENLKVINDFNLSQNSFLILNMQVAQNMQLNLGKFAQSSYTICTTCKFFYLYVILKIICEISWRIFVTMKQIILRDS